MVGTTVHFDGLCQPVNPGGVACYGFVVEREGKVLHRGSGLAAPPFTAEATNNVAEYHGLLAALEWLKSSGFDQEPVVVRGDSQLVINQMMGAWKVRAPHLVPLCVKATKLREGFREIRFEWVPREQNDEADALAAQAYEARLEEDESLRQRVSGHLATEKQLALMRELGLSPGKFLSRMEASRLIAKRLERGT